MHYESVTSLLGYRSSPLFCEDDGQRLVAPADRHWIRAARDVGAKGTYLFRTSPERNALRPAVHVAEAKSLIEAREIHRKIWNQGVNPFIIIVLPGEIRVYTGFAYDSDPNALNDGAILPPIDLVENIRLVLASFTSSAIDRGDIWQANARHLGYERRVDATLLRQLESLSNTLRAEYDLPKEIVHSLIGKFVYLSYLRCRDIVSDRWLREEALVDPNQVFSGKSFSNRLSLRSFRNVIKAVERRFNGLLFPIPWGSPRAPRENAITKIARVFAGEDNLSGQLHLGFRAYDFEHIPVEFLSSIYEHFLHEGPKKSSNQVEKQTADAEPERQADPETRGAHYTPEPLAEYVIAEVDSVKPLRANQREKINNSNSTQLPMRILDPCCGSGIFLVVAYRRLIELECQRQQRTELGASELRDLLVNGIFGVERNATACQITAFSLILTLLSYVDHAELHAQKEFKFPSLTCTNIFHQDFFDRKKPFWKLRDPLTGEPMKFDWIVGNPPWVEVDPTDTKEQPFVTWFEQHAQAHGLARYRTGETFAWKVLDCLADGGAVGLVLHGKALTNDQLRTWRQTFFEKLRVYRLTNLANLAYVIFPSAQEPAITITYTRKVSEDDETPILHFGPFVANVATMREKERVKLRCWTIGFSESEIKEVDPSEAASGDASVWKFALWGSHYDKRAVKRLQRIFSTTLGALATERGWHLGLGLQLRSDDGLDEESPEDTTPNTYVKRLEGLKVLDHKKLTKTRGRTNVWNSPDSSLVKNSIGCYVRENRIAGVALVDGPHLFLAPDFATYSSRDFIILHDKVGLSRGTADEMKAVAALWNTTFIRYLTFFVQSAAWGIGRSTIDKGDAEGMPFPNITAVQIKELSKEWDTLNTLAESGANGDEIQAQLDKHVAQIFGIPQSVTSIVREFFQVRYQLNKGKSPKRLRERPEEKELNTYALALRNKLDGFLGGRSHHDLGVLFSPHGINVSIRIAKSARPFAPSVKRATGKAATQLEGLLKAAEQQFSQWMYVKRSIRIFAGDTIHLIKPPRRIEWTETQAIIDAGDIIAEVLDATRGVS